MPITQTSPALVITTTLSTPQIQGWLNCWWVCEIKKRADEQPRLICSHTRLCTISDMPQQLTSCGLQRCTFGEHGIHGLQSHWVLHGSRSWGRSQVRMDTPTVGLVYLHHESVQVRARATTNCKEHMTRRFTWKLKLLSEQN